MRLDINGGAVAGGSGYATVQDEGTPLTARTTMNFVGAGVVASDVGGVTTVTISGAGAGSTTTGVSTIDFGAFPGVSDISLTVAQASMISTSRVLVALNPIATADHSADEHVVENLLVFAGNVSAGVGFTIYARNGSMLAEPVEMAPGATTFFQATATTVGVKTAQPGKKAYGGGAQPLIYGQWSVVWSWT